MHGDIAFCAQTPQGGLHGLGRDIEFTAEDIDRRECIPVFVIERVKTYKESIRISGSSIDYH